MNTWIIVAAWGACALIMCMWIEKYWDKPITEIPGLVFREKDRDRWLKQHKFERKPERRNDPITVGDIFVFSCGARWYSIPLACLAVGPFGLVFLACASTISGEE